MITRMLVALIAYFSITNCHAEIRYDWTSEEIACAATGNATIGNVAYSFRSTTLESLVWVSDYVVRGVVTNVYQEINDPTYPTRYEVQISSSYKGEVDAQILVLSAAGNYYSTFRDEIVTRAISGGLPLENGQEYIIIISEPADSQDVGFLIVGKGLYSISGSSVGNERFAIEQYRLSSAERRINAAVLAQSSCEAQ